jgi:hypothetical protein
VSRKIDFEPISLGESGPIQKLHVWTSDVERERTVLLHFYSVSSSRLILIEFFLTGLDRFKNCTFWTFDVERERSLMYSKVRFYRGLANSPGSEYSVSGEKEWAPASLFFTTTNNRYHSIVLQ